MNAEDARTWRALARASEHADAALRASNRFLWHAYHTNQAELHGQLAAEHREKAEELEKDLG